MATTEQKPQRLNRKTYLRLIHNSIGTNMFRNFYVQSPKKGEFDALKNGDDSCAFYVSSVLHIFDKIAGVHGTIARTLEDMTESGWKIVQKPKPGDVLVWSADTVANSHRHLGFYVGKDRAVSNSSSKRVPAEHGLKLGKQNRKIELIYRMDNWDDHA